MLLIGEHNWREHVTATVVGGQHMSRGLIPRNYSTHPVGYSAAERAVDMPTIPRSEWPERIRDMEASKSRLSDIRDRGMFGQPIPSRDQNGKGYCWMHSGCAALLLIRARDNQPYVDLSAYMGACLIKQYRDEGGWGAQGLDWIIENGLPDSKFWPQRSMSRSNDTPEMRANAKLYRVMEGWIDLAKPQYDRNLSFEQEITCLLLRMPVIKDENWWGHSICGCDAVDGATQRNVTRATSGKLMTLVEFELAWGMNDPVTAGIGVNIWNSWGEEWGEGGMGVLTGSKAISDGSTCPRTALAA